MSQMGMQLPGARGVRRPQLNIYTALAFVACVCLGAAVVIVWGAASTVSPEEGLTAPFSVQQQGSVRLPD